MSALWMIGLLVAIISVSAFALTLCRAAALADRDVEYPWTDAPPPSSHLVDQAEVHEANVSHLEDQSAIYLEQVGASS